MLRNIVISAAFGAMATFLPCFEWNGSIPTQAVGALALSVDAFILLFGTERRTGDV